MARTDPMFRGKRITICRFGNRETISVIDRTAEGSTGNVSATPPAGGDA